MGIRRRTNHHRHHRRNRRLSPLGFTLIEALLSIVIAAMAAMTLMHGLTSSMQTTEHGTEQAIALGIAEQMADEIMGRLYVGAGESPYSSTLGPESDETGKPRASFDDSDDFHSFGSKPPTSPLAIVLGDDNGHGSLRHPNFRLTPPNFANWRTAVEVYYVSDSDPSLKLSAGTTSNLKAIDVRVLRDMGNGAEREIANVRRIVGYIPSP